MFLSQTAFNASRNRMEGEAVVDTVIVAMLAWIRNSQQESELLSKVLYLPKTRFFCQLDAHRRNHDQAHA